MNRFFRVAFFFLLVSASSFASADITYSQLQSQITSVTTLLENLQTVIHNDIADVIQEQKEQFDQTEDIYSTLNSVDQTLTGCLGYLNSLNYNLSQVADMVSAGNVSLREISSYSESISSSASSIVTKMQTANNLLTSCYTMLYAFYEQSASDNEDIKSLLGQIDTSINTLTEVQYSATYALSMILDKLSVLNSISSYTGGTYSNLVALSEYIKGGVLVNLGPTNVEYYQYNVDGPRWRYLDSFSGDLATMVVGGAYVQERVPVNQWLHKIGAHLGSINVDTTHQRKSGILTADYLLNTQKGLLQGASANLADIYTILDDWQKERRQQAQAMSNQTEQAAADAADMANSFEPLDDEYRSSLGDLDYSSVLSNGGGFLSSLSASDSPDAINFGVGQYSAGGHLLFGDTSNSYMTISLEDSRSDMLISSVRAFFTFVWWGLLGLLAMFVWRKVVFLYSKIVEFTSGIGTV